MDFEGGQHAYPRQRSRGVTVWFYSEELYLRIYSTWMATYSLIETATYIYGN